MASKSKSRAPRKERKGENSLAQFGLLNIPSLDIDVNEDDSGGDDDLESELEALLSGKNISKPREKKKAPRAVDIEQLAADCLKDSDGDDDDANLSGDEELLAELKAIAPEPSSFKQSVEKEVFPEATGKSATVANSTVVLEERIKLYEEAVRIAKESNDNLKSRRYGRALKTLHDLLKSAKSGNDICEDDIPPILNLPKKMIPRAEIEKPKHDDDVPTATPVFNPSAKTSASEQNLFVDGEAMTVKKQLVFRRDQYKVAALKAKKSGDTDTALNYVKIAKKFDSVIAAEEAGQPIDLSNMPPPPPRYLESTQITIIKPEPERKIQDDEVQKSYSIEAAALAAASEPEDPTMFAAPPTPLNVNEALKQRLDKYISTRDSAQAEGNSSKVRRLQRIVKQYEVAIKDYNAGKPVDFDELPIPPGFAPIPKESSHSNPTSNVQKPTGIRKQQNTESAVQTSKERPSADATKQSEMERKKNQEIEKKTGTQEKKAKLRRADTSTVLEKQLEFLLERQKMFRQAALSSKKNGDIQQAKEYLRMSKGFDSMIEATKSGLPIDATTIPTPPQLESDFVIIDTADCEPHAEGSKEELFESLERDLSHQIEVCSRNKEHFLRLGDVSSASKFEKLGLESRKDLSVIQHLNRNGEPLPRFHYETRLFSMVQCHADLGDNDLEVTIERGINLPGKPDELDSYVKVEFPIPPETPQRAKTHTVRDTNNPIFQEEFKFEVNRKSRSQVRHFKRQSIKLEVFSKGGFLRSDALLGTVAIKLIELESKCSIHDSFDLMDGRKACGGKLEIKVRIRDPLFVKQVEEVREKWLVIGS